MKADLLERLKASEVEDDILDQVGSPGLLDQPPLLADSLAVTNAWTNQSPTSLASPPAQDDSMTEEAIKQAEEELKNQSPTKLKRTQILR